MAEAKGSIADIAKGVANKCNDYVLNDSSVASGLNKDPDKVLEFFERKTLNDAFQRVTEARAGNCDKPKD